MDDITEETRREYGLVCFKSDIYRMLRKLRFDEIVARSSNTFIAGGFCITACRCDQRRA